MKKIISRRDFFHLCPVVQGWDLPQFGIPYVVATGVIFEEHLDEMLAAVEANPDLHIVSVVGAVEGQGYNKYVPGMGYYYLAYGDNNPNIEYDVKLNPPYVFCQKRFDWMQGLINQFLEEAQNDLEFKSLQNTAVARLTREKC